MKKKRTVIFGAGGTGRRVYGMIKEEADVVFFVDNDPEKWGRVLDNLEIRNPSVLSDLEQYDEICMGTLMGLAEVQEQLAQLDVPMDRLNKEYAEISVKSRILFLKRFSQRAHLEGIAGAVGECGVYRGEFAKEINRYFSDRTCYLFDTFEGFDERDFQYEKAPSMTRGVHHLSMTSEDAVLKKMPYRDRVVLKKGYFPESVGNLEERFAFINLDMDLYRPTLEGLRYFYPRMSNGGVMLIHDYFSEIFPNVEKAVDDFEKEVGIRLHKMPIGDDISMAVLK